MTCWLEVGSYTMEDEERANGEVAEEREAAEDCLASEACCAAEDVVNVADDSGAGPAGSRAVVPEERIEDEDAKETSVESQMEPESSCSVRAMLSSAEDTALSPQAVIMAATAVMGKMNFFIDIGNLFFQKIPMKKSP